MKTIVSAVLLFICLGVSPAFCQLNATIGGTLSTAQDRTTGVTPGSYTCPTETVDATGRVTAIANGSCSGGGGSGRTILSANLTQYVSVTGSDTTGNGTSGSPWATCSHAYAVDQATIDLAGFTITCSMASGSYTAFCWTFNGPLVGAVSPASFTISGPGQFGSVLTGSTGCGEFYAKNMARIEVTAANIVPGSGGFGMLVYHGEIDFGTVEFLDQGSGSNFGDVAGGDSVLACIAGFELVSGSGGNVSNVFVSEDHGLITLNCALAMAGAPTYTTFAQADLGGMIDGTGFTYSGGTPTGSRYSAILNGIVFTGGVGGASFYPGSTAGSASSGGIYD